MGRSGRLSIGAIAAAVAAGQVAPNHLAAAVALGLAAVLLLAESRPRLGARSLLPVLAGAALIVLRLAVAPAGPAALDLPPTGDGPWTLVVSSTGSPRDGQQVATLRTPPDAAVPFTVAATLPRYPVVIPGDRVVVDGRILPRPDSSYGSYLERIGAAGTLQSRTIRVEPVPDEPGRRLEALRRDAAEALARVLPEPEAGLAAGILIGLRDAVDRDLAAAFTTAGVSHVVAISGWNIAIVAAAIAALTGRVGRRRRSIMTIVAIVAYVAFAGGSPSVVRAALMAGVVLLARESGRAGRASAALGWAATLLLATDPSLIGDAGFQLSSLATAGLIAWATPLTGWIERVGRGHVPRWLAESLGVSLAAQAATLPIILVSFGRLAILSPVVNLVVVPLVAPAMAAGVVALAGGGLVLAGAPPVIGALVAAPGWVILRVLVAIVTLAAGLPFASVTLEPPLDVVAATLSTLALAGLVWSRRARATNREHGAAAGTNRADPKVGTVAPTSTRRRPLAAGRTARRVGAISMIGSLLIAGAVVAATPAGGARISVLDVGQGDAILVEGSRGGRLLIDGGPDPDRLLVALDRRIPPWDRRIDAIILSHPHEDHVAGLALLLERYRVGRVFEPGMHGPGPGYAAWARRLSAVGAPMRLGLAAGDRLSVDEIHLRVLWPIRGQVPFEPADGGTAINNVSVVLLGEIGPSRVLLMGDVEEGIDPSLLADGLPHVDLLKVAHHGSKTATTEPFIEATRPKVAVASAGAGNPYGHPAKATLDRLAAAGARVLRTDRDGTVVVGFEAGQMTVRTEGIATADVAIDPERAARVAVPASALGLLGQPAPRPDPDRGLAFLCAIPVTGLVPDRRPSMAAAPVPDWSDGGSTPYPGRASVVGYHRDDDGARAGGGRLPAALPRSPTLAAPPRARRGRGRGLAGGSHRGARRDRRSPARRVGGLAPRCRQGALGRRPCARPPPR
jgi:competence protein ComEC